MTDPSTPAAELETWQEIAGYLRISIREAQYRARDEGLPVRRGTGKKARVWALRAELDAWSAARLRSGAGSVASSPPPAEAGELEHGAPIRPHDSPPGSASFPGRSGQEGGTGLHQAGDGQPPIVASPNRFFSRRNVLAGTAVGVGAFLVPGIGSRHGREMAMLSLDGPALIARDASGRELWRHVFSGGIFLDYYQPAGFDGAYWIGDLDGDGRAEALFRYDSAQAVGQSSSFYCFSHSGDIKWVFHPGRVVRDSGGEIQPLYRTVTFLVSFNTGPARRACIAVSSVHSTEQPCQLAFLDASGTLTAEYWHPGHLRFLIQGRAGLGGGPRIIAGGVNNGEHRATLVVLDPFAMKGASTPPRMRDQRFRLLDMPEAHEDLVVLFPRTCLSRDEPYTWAREIGADEQAVRVMVAESHDMSSLRIVRYEFDPSFVLRRAFLSTEYREEHLRLERSGELSHSADADEAELVRGLEIRRNTP